MMSSSDVRRSPGIGYLDPVEPVHSALARRPLSGLGLTGTSGSCIARGSANVHQMAKGGQAATEGSQLLEGDKVPGRPADKCADATSEKENLGKAARIDSL